MGEGKRLPIMILVQGLTEVLVYLTHGLTNKQFHEDMNHWRITQALCLIGAAGMFLVEEK
jgi:hypothetical protein